MKSVCDDGDWSHAAGITKSAAGAMVWRKLDPESDLDDGRWLSRCELKDAGAGVSVISSVLRAGISWAECIC